jgi:hypothetical protein
VIVKTGHAVADLVIVGAVVLQGISLGISPTTTTAINSLALLAIAIIGAWQAAKASARDKQIAAIKQTSNATKRVAEATHTLTNSAMGAQLLSTVEMLKEMLAIRQQTASIPPTNDNKYGMDALSVRIKLAEDLYQKHVIAQAKVDAKIDSNVDG